MHKILMILLLGYGITHAKVADPNVTLVAQDGKKFSMARAIAKEKEVSGVLAAALEFEADVREIPIALDSASLEILLPVLQLLGKEKLGQVSSWKQATEMVEARSFALFAIEPELRLLQQRDLPALINAANYLQAHIVLEALLLRYAKDVVNKEQLLKDGIQKEWAPQIARYHFLQTGEDIEEQLKVAPQAYSFDTLKLWLFPKALVERFPGLVEAQVNKANESGETPLQFVVRLASSEKIAGTKAVNALLKVKTIDVNAGGALCWAAVADDLVMVQKLLAKGASPVMRCQTVGGDTPVAAAARGCGSRVLSELLALPDVQKNIQSPDVGHAVLRAYKVGNLVNVRHLLEAGAQFPKKDNFNEHLWDVRKLECSQVQQRANDQARATVKALLKKQGRTDVSL
jgi:hypothetical protein